MVVDASTQRREHVQHLEAEISVLQERLQEQIHTKTMVMAGKDRRVQELKEQLYSLIHAERAAAEQRRRSEQDLLANSDLQSALEAAVSQKSSTEAAAQNRRKTHQRLRELELGLAAQEEANAWHLNMAREAEQALSAVRSGAAHTSSTVDNGRASTSEVSTPRQSSAADGSGEVPPLQSRLAGAQSLTAAREKILSELRQRTAQMSAELQQVSESIATSNASGPAMQDSRLEEACAAVQQAAEIRRTEAARAEALTTKLQEMRQSASGTAPESELLQSVGEGTLAAELRALRVRSAAAGVDAAKSDPTGKELIDTLVT